MLKIEDLRDVFTNHGSPPPSTQPRSYLPDFPMPSPGNVLVPGTPDDDDDDEVVVLSSDEERDALPPPPPKRRKMVAEVVLTVRDFAS